MKRLVILSHALEHCDFAAYIMAIKNTEDDVIRERELFRYFRPPVGDNVQEGPYVDGSVEEAIVNKAIESPDKTLTALAQLAACRLDASRAMISVIGEEMQYFIAEATRTLQLSDTSKSEDIKDGLWVGCATVNKEGRLCEVCLTPVSTYVMLRLPENHRACSSFWSLSLLYSDGLDR